MNILVIGGTRFFGIPMVEELLRRGYHGGVINVSLPETPIFTPQEV